VTPRQPNRDRDHQAVYAEGLRALVAKEVPFLVGGGYALYWYLGRWRSTKDIDIFIRASVLEQALDALAGARFDVEVTDPAWLGKARKRGALIDVIFCSYNGLFPVDGSWDENGREAEVLGIPVRVVAPEEMIVSKCFVAARDRFDGADVSWLIRALGRTLDWRRIETLMHDHWQVLLWQLVHFLYVFPSERRQIPQPLLARLLARLGDPRSDRSLACRGPMLDPRLYDREIEESGDPRPRRDLAGREGELSRLIRQCEAS
jgi:hypothetical protein